MKRGITLIELLVVIAIVVILISLIISAGVGTSQVTALVENKYTVLEEDGRAYRVMLRDQSGDANEYNSYWVHDKLSQGNWYRLKIRGNYITEVIAQLPPPNKEQ